MKYLRERSDKGLDYLNRHAGKLRESVEGLVKKGKEFMGRQNRGSVKTDTEAEEQAYPANPAHKMSPAAGRADRPGRPFCFSAQSCL